MQLWQPTRSPIAGSIFSRRVFQLGSILFLVLDTFSLLVYLRFGRANPPYDNQVALLVVSFIVLQSLISWFVMVSFRRYAAQELSAKAMDCWTVGVGVPWVILSCGIFFALLLKVIYIFNIVGCLLVLVAVERNIHSVRIIAKLRHQGGN